MSPGRSLLVVVLRAERFRYGFTVSRHEARGDKNLRALIVLT